MAFAVSNKMSLRRAATPAVARKQVVVRAAAAAPANVPDMNKRNIMNLILLGGVAVPATGMLGAYALFFVPKSAGGAGGGQVAKDALGNDVKSNSWLATHAKGDHSLVQGLKGDPTYLVVTADGTIENYGINAVCTHLGCVVPWVAAENKFKCPCHGSQYDATGKKIRGPAPLSLALAHCNVDGSDNVLLSAWTETDFRTGEEPWWK